MLEKGANSRGVQAYRSAPGRGLGVGKLEAITIADKLSLDGDSAKPEVEIAPNKPDQLAAAHPRGRR